MSKLTITFEYSDGTKESYGAYRVTPYAPKDLRCQNPSEDTIAEALEEGLSWIILSGTGLDGEDGIEKIINPHQIKSITKNNN